MYMSPSLPASTRIPSSSSSSSDNTSTTSGQYNVERRQLVGLIRECVFLLEMVDCFLPREIYGILGYLLYFLCIS